MSDCIEADLVERALALADDPDPEDGEANARALKVVGAEVGRLRGEARHLRKQNAELQEIALRVKLGQLEVWPDASQTHVGQALTEARAETECLRAQLERTQGHLDDFMGATARATLEAQRLQARNVELQQLGRPRPDAVLDEACAAEAKRRELHFARTCSACGLKMLSATWTHCPQCDAELAQPSSPDDT